MARKKAPVQVKKPTAPLPGMRADKGAVRVIPVAKSDEDAPIAAPSKPTVEVNLAPARQLNPDFPYMTVHGQKPARFLQDGVYFDVNGKEVGLVAHSFESSSKETMLKELQKRERILARKKELASMSTQLIGSTVAQTEQENQQARLAERYAED